MVLLRRINAILQIVRDNGPEELEFIVTKLFMTLMLIVAYKGAFALETVPRVDIKRCMGDWYEIASIPNLWQADCYKNTKSHYGANSDGTFDLKKSCLTKGGQKKEITGTGLITNKETNAEFRISFIPILHYLGWFTGQYKMLLVDPEYRFAVLGTDSLEYGWILARLPNIPPRELAQIETQIRQMGYDSCKFKITIQERGPHMQAKPLCEVVKP